MIFTCSNARSGSPGAVEGAEVAQWWGKETWSRKGPFPAISGCLLASQLWRLGPTHASLFLGTHKGWGRNGFSFLLNWLKFLTKDTHSSRFLLAWWPATGRRGLAASWARAWDELGAGGTDRREPRRGLGNALLHCSTANAAPKDTCPLTTEHVTQGTISPR